MTGKDLILYILQNNLESEVIIKDGALIRFMNEEEAAVKFDVGVGTIKAWCDLGILKGTRIGDSVYFLKRSDDKS